MSSRVVILGAGFSQAAGVPSQKDLLKRIVNIHDYVDLLDSFDTEILSDKEIVEIFIEHLFKNTVQSKISLEDLYTIIDRSVIKQRNIGIFDVAAIIQVRESLDRLISFVVNKEINEDAITKIYLPLIEELEKTNTLGFISLNWDFLLEKVLFTKSISTDYVVPLETMVFQKHLNYSNKYKVLKPHGSLNWLYCPICETIYSDIDFSTHNISLSKCHKCEKIYNANIKNLHSLKQFHNIFIRKGLMPLLISPTFIKDNSSPHLNFLFQEIYNFLVNSEELIFIGYSLPISDHDIRNILIKANSVNQNSKIKVILKENRPDQKQYLMNNYKSIYGENNIEFYWNGFNDLKYIFK